MTAVTEPVASPFPLHPRTPGARLHRSGLRELTVARADLPTAAPVAALLGRFADEFEADDISVSFVPPVAVADAVADDAAVAAADDAADDALVHETGVLDTLHRHERGVRTRLVGLAWVDSRAVVAGRRSSAHHGPPALRGRRLALPTGAGDPTGARRAGALRAYESALALAGLGLRDVTLVPVDGSVVEALTAGVVDAVHLPDPPTAHLVRTHGIQVLVDLSAYPDPRTRVHDLAPLPITVRTELLEQAPDVVARYLAALLDASAWSAANGERFRRLVRLCDGAFPLDRLTHDVHHRLTVDLSKERLGLLAAQQRFLARHGFVSGGLDVVDWADPAPLGTARDLLAGRRYGRGRR